MFSRDIYDNMQDAMSNRYKKGRERTIKVELTEEEFTTLKREINTLKNKINVLTDEHQQQIRSLKSQNENYLKKLEDGHQAQVELLDRRMENLKNAIKKWRVKAGVDEPGLRELVSAERKLTTRGSRGEWHFVENWTVPVERSPEFAREAWAWLEAEQLTEFVDRLFFHEKLQKWVSAIRTRW